MGLSLWTKIWVFLCILHQGNDGDALLRCHYATRARCKNTSVDASSSHNQSSGSANPNGCSNNIVACTVRGRRFVCEKHAKEGDEKLLGAAVNIKSAAGKNMRKQVHELLWTHIVRWRFRMKDACFFVLQRKVLSEEQQTEYTELMSIESMMWVILKSFQRVFQSVFKQYSMCICMEWQLGSM